MVRRAPATPNAMRRTPSLRRYNRNILSGNARLFAVAAVVLAGGLSLETSATAQSNRRANAEAPMDPVAAVDRIIAAAETNLRDNELHLAESQYRTALFDGWMILGQLHVAAGRLVEARDAFRQASTSVVDADAAVQLLALVNLQMGESAEAVTLLTRLAGRAPGNAGTARLLAQAQMANGQVGEALQTLEEAHTADANDAELTFALASAYVRAGKLDAADPLFTALRNARPGAETDVLIGRTYRDSGFYDRARASLERALKQDPRTRRAHYYLGTLAVMDEGVLRLDEAISEFRAELKLAAADPVTNLRLGMALVEADRPAEALPHLRTAAKSESAPAEAFYYLGRCQLALDAPADAVASLGQALSIAAAQHADQARI